jgi:hypothetical protein
MVRDFRKRKPFKPQDVDRETEPLAWAGEQFRRMDYQHQLESVGGMQPSEVPQSISVNENFYALRKKGSQRVKLVPVEYDNWVEVGKGLPDTPTPEALAARGFQWHRGPSQTVTNGGRITRVTPMRDLLEGKDYISHELIGEDKEATAPPLPQPVEEFMGYHSADEGDKEKSMGRVYNRFKEMVDDGTPVDDALDRTVGAMFPNLNFKMIDPGEWKDRWWPVPNSYARGKNEYIAAVPGKLTPLPGKDGTIVYQYYDKTTNQIYDSGTFSLVGTLDKGIADAATITGEEMPEGWTWE